MDLLKSFALSLFSVIKIKLYAANFPCANPGGHVCKYALSAGEDDSVRLNPREEATVFLVRKPALNGKDGSVSFEVDAKRDYYLVKDGAKYIVSKFEPTKQFGKLKLFNKLNADLEIRERVICSIAKYIGIACAGSFIRSITDHMIERKHI